MLTALLSKARPPSASIFHANMRSVHSQSDSWVFVTDVHTKSRTPQFNGDNMSSSQVANASAKNNSNSDNNNTDITGATALLLPEANAGDTTNITTATATAYNPDTHNPPSNVDTSSTETAGTNDTVTNTPSGLDLGPTSGPRAPSFPELTQSNMNLHQRELATGLYTGSVAGWVVGAGVGMPRCVVGGGGSMAASSYAGGSSMMLGSGSAAAASSVAGLDWMVIPSPTLAANETFGCGEWCGAATGPVLARRFSGLSLD